MLSPSLKNPRNESAAPLFLKDGKDGNKGNAQDEKDTTSE
jgi:hypothetical protein